MSYSIMGYGSVGLGAFGAQPTIGVGRANPPAVVKLWQAFIGVNADGKFGPDTAKATQLWQFTQGIGADGIVGPATWAKADQIQAIMDATGGGGGGTTVVIPGMGPVSLPPGVQLPPGATVPALPPGLPPGPVAAPVPTGPPSSGPIAQLQSWWGAQAKPMQYAAMGGGLLAVAGLVFLLMSDDKKKRPAARPNRKRTLEEHRKWQRRTRSYLKRRHLKRQREREPTFPFRRLPATPNLRTRRSKEPYLVKVGRTKARSFRTKRTALKFLHSAERRRGMRYPHDSGVSLNFSVPSRKRRRAKRSQWSIFRENRSTCHRKPPKKYRSKGATARADYADPACYKYPIRFRKKGRVKRKITMAHIRAAASRFGKHKRRYPKTTRKQIARRIQAAERKYGIGAR